MFASENSNLRLKSRAVGFGNRLKPNIAALRSRPQRIRCVKYQGGEKGEDDKSLLDLTDDALEIGATATKTWQEQPLGPSSTVLIDLGEDTGELPVSFCVKRLSKSCPNSEETQLSASASGSPNVRIQKSRPNRVKKDVVSKRRVSKPRDFKSFGAEITAGIERDDSHVRRMLQIFDINSNSQEKATQHHQAISSPAFSFPPIQKEKNGDRDISKNFDFKLELEKGTERQDDEIFTLKSRVKDLEKLVEKIQDENTKLALKNVSLLNKNSGNSEKLFSGKDVDDINDSSSKLDGENYEFVESISKLFGLDCNREACAYTNFEKKLENLDSKTQMLNTKSVLEEAVHLVAERLVLIGSSLTADRKNRAALEAKKDNAQRKRKELASALVETRTWIQREVAKLRDWKSNMRSIYISEIHAMRAHVEKVLTQSLASQKEKLKARDADFEDHANTCLSFLSWRIHTLADLADCELPHGKSNNSFLKIGEFNNSLFRHLGDMDTSLAYVTKRLSHVFGSQCSQIAVLTSENRKESEFIDWLRDFILSPFEKNKNMCFNDLRIAVITHIEQEKHAVIFPLATALQLSDFACAERSSGWCKDVVEYAIRKIAQTEKYNCDLSQMRAALNETQEKLERAAIFSLELQQKLEALRERCEHADAQKNEAIQKLKVLKKQEKNAPCENTSEALSAVIETQSHLQKSLDWSVVELRTLSKEVVSIHNADDEFLNQSEFLISQKVPKLFGQVCAQETQLERRNRIISHLDALSKEKIKYELKSDALENLVKILLTQYDHALQMQTEKIANNQNSKNSIDIESHVHREKTNCMPESKNQEKDAQKDIDNFSLTTECALNSKEKCNREVKAVAGSILNDLDAKLRFCETLELHELVSSVKYATCGALQKIDNLGNVIAQYQNEASTKDELLREMETSIQKHVVDATLNCERAEFFKSINYKIMEQATCAMSKLGVRDVKLVQISKIDYEDVAMLFEKLDMLTETLVYAVSIANTSIISGKAPLVETAVELILQAATKDSNTLEKEVLNVPDFPCVCAFANTEKDLKNEDEDQSDHQNENPQPLKSNSKASLLACQNCYDVDKNLSEPTSSGYNIEGLYKKYMQACRNAAEAAERSRAEIIELEKIWGERLDRATEDAKSEVQKAREQQSISEYRWRTACEALYAKFRSFLERHKKEGCRLHSKDGETGSSRRNMVADYDSQVSTLGSEQGKVKQIGKTLKTLELLSKKV